MTRPDAPHPRSVLSRLRIRLRLAARDDSGFTLVEVIVSSVLFVIVAAASVTAIVAGVKADNTSRNRVMAANVAQADVEQARALAFPNYPTAEAAHSVTVGNATFTVQRTVSNACPAVWSAGQPTSMQVTTTVSWPGSASTIKVATVIAC